MNEYENEIDTIVKSVAKSNGFNNYEISPIETNTKGEGYLSKIFTLTIKDKSSDNKLDILLKCAFKNEQVRKSVPIITKIFEKEIHFYSVIYPELEEFRKSVGCPKEYELIAKCYETSARNLNEFLVFDNLKAQGFSMLDKSLDLTIEHAELVFRNYGYFHALSLGFKHKHPEKFLEITSKIEASRSLFNFFAETATRTVQEINKVLLPGRDDAIIEQFQKYLKAPLELLMKSIVTDSRYTVIKHGDSRTSNQLFKYDEKTGKPIDLRLVDWQIITVGSPVCDLSYMLYSDATKSVLDRLEDYLKIYYDTLSSTLRKLGCDPEKVFPFEELNRQWKLNSVFGFLIGGMIVREKCTLAVNVEDFVRGAGNFENLMYGDKYDVERYNQKIYDLVSHMYEIGVL